MKTQHKVQVWVVNRLPEEDRYLLLKVIPERGSGWHPITGSVEKDERKTQDWLGAAKRETEEETAISSTAGQWVDLELKFEFDGRWGHAEERAFGLILTHYA